MISFHSPGQLTSIGMNIIGIKDLQMNFIDNLKMTGLYNEAFLQGIGEAQEDIHRGRVTTHESSDDFLKSLRFIRKKSQ